MCVCVCVNHTLACLHCTILLFVPLPLQYTKPDLISSSSGAPLELWKLTDFLYSRLQTPGLFLTDGKDSEIDQIRELLDRGVAAEDGQTCILAAALECASGTIAAGLVW